MEGIELGSELPEGYGEGIRDGIFVGQVDGFLDGIMVGGWDGEESVLTDGDLLRCLVGSKLGK